MNKLTKEILREEEKKYFKDTILKFELGSEKLPISKKKRIFPEYDLWKKDHKDKSSYTGENFRDMESAMNSYILETVHMAEHLIENDYPTEDILSFLPSGFSSAIKRRLSQ